MNTDKITENLIKQAMDQAKEKLTYSAKTYNQAIGLSGTCEVIKLKDRKTGAEIEVYTAAILEEITMQLLEKRSGRIETQAINGFLSKFGQFNDYMHQMENYTHE